MVVVAVQGALSGIADVSDRRSIHGDVIKMGCVSNGLLRAVGDGTFQRYIMPQACLKYAAS